MKGDINPEENISNNQDELQLRSTGRLYMNYFCKIIVGIYSYLQEHNDKEIEVLFSNAIDVFNALGSWVYGGCSPKIVYPNLQLFVKKANSSSTKSFSHLLDYINWVGNRLYKILEKNHWAQQYYYESFTLEKNNDITTGLLFMWRLGWQAVNLKDISNQHDFPISFQSLKAFDSLFDAFGEWIYNREGLFNITHSFHAFEKIFEEEFEPYFDEILEEVKTTRTNIAKFLQEIK